MKRSNDLRTEATSTKTSRALEAMFTAMLNDEQTRDDVLTIGLYDVDGNRRIRIMNNEQFALMA